MNTLHEKKYLRGILKYLDRAPRSVFLSPWFKVAHWIVLALLFFALFKMEARAEVLIAVGVAFVVGMGQGFSLFQEFAIRCWPFIRPHLSRETIEARIAELDESEKISKRS